MEIRATVTKGDFIAGEQYDIEPGKAMAMIIAGDAEPITVARPLREKKIKVPNESRAKWHTK